MKHIDNRGDIMETISFSEAFKYPFKVPKRLLYILWIIIPILGWFALSGYIVRLVNEFIEGKYEGLPELHFVDDMKLGFMIFLKAIPFVLVFTVVIFVIIFAVAMVNESAAYWLYILLIIFLAIFVVPILEINFFRKQTVGSFFEFRVLSAVKDNLGEYIIAILKQYVLVIIFSVLMLILVGFPALYFTTYIFIANFYGKFVEKEAYSAPNFVETEVGNTPNFEE